MGGDELPVRFGLAQAVLHPFHFRVPEVFEPLCAPRYKRPEGKIAYSTMIPINSLYAPLRCP